MDDKIMFDGYHVTDKNSALKIIQEQEFKPKNNDDHYLGQGSYFFEDFKIAKLYVLDDKNNFFNKKLNASEKALIVATINVTKSKCLDLDNFENLYNFDEWFTDYLKRLCEGDKKIVITKKCTELTHFAFDFYKKSKGFIVLLYSVPKSTPPYSVLKTSCPQISYWGFQYKEKYICVSDNSVINNIRQYKETI